MNVWLGSGKPSWDLLCVQIDCPNPTPMYGEDPPSLILVGIVGLLKLGPVP
jgi:hypothetical protein